MISDERWRNNWLVVSPPGSVRVDLGRSAGTREAPLLTVRDLSPGTTVILCASAPGAIGRCRAFASVAGIELEREYLAFPSAGTPAYLVEDARAPLGVFVKTVLVTPPGAPFSTLIGAFLSVLRSLNPWWLIPVLAPGRIVVGTRS